MLRANSANTANDRKYMTTVGGTTISLEGRSQTPDEDRPKSTAGRFMTTPAPPAPAPTPTEKEYPVYDRPLTPTKQLERVELSKIQPYR